MVKAHTRQILAISGNNIGKTVPNIINIIYNDECYTNKCDNNIMSTTPLPHTLQKLKHKGRKIMGILKVISVSIQWLKIIVTNVHGFLIRLRSLVQPD